MNSPTQSLPGVSEVFADGTVVEMAYQPTEAKTSFIVWKDGQWSREQQFQTSTGRVLVPYSPYNNLVKNEVVLFPSEPAEYGSEDELIQALQDFIHRYVDVGPLYEKIASYYILFTWVYDGFNELPYLRVRGDYGSGKTRFLLTVGRLCYKPIFASGASTVSPLFRLLDTFRGTLVIDECDFRLSTEQAEVVKIFNQGNSKGFPVLRSEVVGTREFNPRAYQVFGPKLVATRGYFDDRALESRFITEEMGLLRLRDDIPINLPPSHREEALALRNKLLLFRFRNLHKRQPIEGLVDRQIEPRLNQIFVPLLSIISDSQARENLRELARRYDREIVAERGMSIEAQLLEVIREIASAPEGRQPSIKQITERFVERYQEDYERKVTSKWIGSIVRKRLSLKPQKSHGVYVIPLLEEGKLQRLYQKYGLVGNGEASSPNGS